MASFLFQTFGEDGREQFNSNRPPLCFLGKVVSNPNTGLPITSNAFSQGGPDMNPKIERCDVQVPAGTTLIAVMGDKLPTRMVVNPYNQLLNFYGTRAGTATFYCFGRYSKQPATSGWVFEVYNEDGSMAFDAETRFFSPASGNFTGRMNVPAGRTWAAVVVGIGVSDFKRRGLNGVVYQYVNFAAAYTNPSYIELQNLTIDIVRMPPVTGEDDVGEVYRTASMFAVDVTGL